MTDLSLGSLSADILADTSLNVPDTAPASAQATTPTPDVTQTQAAAPDPPSTSDPAVTQTPEPTTATQTPADPQETQRGYLRDADYRQKTMRLAEERRAYETERQALQTQLQQAQQLHQAIQDPRWLEQHYAQLVQQLNVPPADQPLNAQQAEQLVQRRLAEQSAVLNAQVERTLRNAEVARYRMDYEHDLDNHVTSLLDKHKELADDYEPGELRDLLTKDLTKAIKAGDIDQPATIAQAKKVFADFAKARAEKRAKVYQAREQAAIMRHTKVTKPAIEPKGGQAPIVSSPVKHKFGSKSHRDSMIAELEAGELS